jgi:hypothetical protein
LLLMNTEVCFVSGLIVILVQCRLGSA